MLLLFLKILRGVAVIHYFLDSNLYRSLKVSYFCNFTILSYKMPVLEIEPTCRASTDSQK